ncbi:MAG: hypothetical protein RL095_2686 [Verrucomicrobiota bacterium]|jgi:CYTH domain-containing protein
MGLEIERKFLVAGRPWEGLPGELLSQAYLARGGVTVRIRRGEGRAWLTVKGRSDGAGLSRAEFEYEIPDADAEAMLRLCEEAPLSKRRYRLIFGSHLWEIDVFEGDNLGLVVAEIELDAEKEEFLRPPWLGREVSAEPRYRNSSLAKHPWKSWSPAEQAESRP